jgi:hypothetical protein
MKNTVLENSRTINQPNEIKHFDQNSSRIELKNLILKYSKDVKNYAKWFEISQIDKKQGSYTVYKVVYRVSIPNTIEKRKFHFIIFSFLFYKQVFAKRNFRIYQRINSLETIP